LKSLNDVEIFEVGQWNGDPYTENDLDEMVRAFNETNGNFQPYIKIGHDKEQNLLKESELPAAGYVANLKRVGKKLLADIIDIPEKIYFLMKNKAYKSRSSEIFWDIDFNGNKYSRMLKAVALLGADMPAVSTLDDIINFYGLDAKKAMGKNNSSATLKICSFEETLKKDKEMTEKKIKELESDLEKKTKDYNQKEADLKAKEAELAEKEKAYNKLLEEKKNQEIELRAKEVKNFAEKMVDKKLATPGMKPLIEKILGDDAKEYSIETKVKKDDKEETNTKKYNSKSEMVEEMLRLFSEAAKVNFEENSDDVTPESNKEKDLEARIEKYAADNKVRYSDAYKIVMAEANQSDDEDEE